jgi:hypothetical protein
MTYAMKMSPLACSAGVSDMEDSIAFTIRAKDDGTLAVSNIDIVNTVTTFTPPTLAGSTIKMNTMPGVAAPELFHATSVIATQAANVVTATLTGTVTQGSCFLVGSRGDAPFPGMTLPPGTMGIGFDVTKFDGGTQTVSLPEGWTATITE